MDVKRTQVYLDAWSYETLRREAFRRRASFSSVLREILHERFSGPRRNTLTALKRIVGIGRDRARDVAEHHDDYLAGTKE